jgi:hypothetical protein
MAYLELQNYILEQEKKGISRAQLREILITRGGWREDVVMDAFMAIDTARQAQLTGIPVSAPSTQQPVVTTPSVDAIRPATAIPTTFEQSVSTVTSFPVQQATPVEQPSVQQVQQSVGMSPVQAQDKMNILDSLYTARAGAAPVTQPLQQSQTIAQPTQPFMGMPGVNVQPVTPSGPAFLKKFIMILIGLAVVGVVAFGAWYAYGYFIKPTPAIVFSQVSKHLATQEQLPFHVVVSLQGIKKESDTSSELGTSTLETTGTYDIAEDSFTGKLSLANDDKAMYGLLYAKAGNQITIAPVTESELIKTIPSDGGITFDTSNVDLARSYLEKTYASDVIPSWAAFDAVQPIIEKVLPRAKELVTYATSLPDVTEKGSRMRHFLLGQDQIASLPENVKPFIASVRAQVKEAEVWTTWYPEKIQKVHLVIVSKDETSSWQTADITITFPTTVDATVFPEKTTNLQTYLEGVQIQEAKQQQDTFFAVAFNQANLYKSTKNTLKGFCTSNSGLADLLIGGGLYTTDTVSCKEALQGVSVTLKDPMNSVQFVCRDMMLAEPITLTTKPLTAVCQ